METLILKISKPPAPQPFTHPPNSTQPMEIISDPPPSNHSIDAAASSSPHPSPTLVHPPTSDPPTTSVLLAKIGQLTDKVDASRNQHLHDQRQLLRQEYHRDNVMQFMKMAKDSNSPGPNSPPSIFSPSEKALETLSNAIQFLHTLPEESRRLITQRAQYGRRVFTFGLDRTPTADEAAAIARISLLLISLSSSDRGFVCVELNRAFNLKPRDSLFSEYPPSPQPTTTRHERLHPSPKPRKLAWKVTWHKSDEFVKFKQAHDMKPLTNREEIAKLWLPAKDLRDRLRAEWQSQHPDTSSPPPPSPLSPSRTAKSHNKHSTFAAGFRSAIASEGDY